MASDRLTLGFDTSAAHCAAAVVSGDRVLSSLCEEMRKGQAERLMPLLEDALADAGVTFSDLSVIGVGTGPGNFTGTRIAVAAGRGLSLALGIPAEGVTSVEAYCDGRNAVACLPAPRGMVHLGWEGEVRLWCEEDAMPDGWPSALTGPAAQDVAMATGLPVRPSPDLAAAIARIAGGRAGPERPRPAPMYLRPADAAPARDQPPTIL